MEDITVEENTFNFPAHTIVTLQDRAKTYTTYTDWVRKHAERYFDEYYRTDYRNYFNNEPDILAVLCSGIHSKENPITLCLCRSLTTDKLILVGAADITIENRQFANCNKAIYKILNTSKVNHIYDILVPRLYPATYSKLSDEMITDIRESIQALFDKFNISYKEEDLQC